MAFRKPKTQIIGGKFLVYGATHEGKSWFGLTFPKVAVIDSEAGTAFDEGDEIEIAGRTYNNMVLVDTTADLDELEENLDAIIDGDVDCETLVVDSETKFYTAMDIGATEVEEKKARANGKNVDNRAKWGRVKQMTMKLQQAKLTVSAKGKHVVSTAQAKEIKEDNTNKVIGYKPDCHSSLPFDYDVVLRFFTETDKKTKERKFYAEVIKDRTHVTKVGSIIENCTYDVWKDYFENRTKKGYKSEANFTNDLKKSVGNVLNEAEKSEKLAEDIKTLIKELKGNEEGLASFKKKVSDMKIDLKALDMEDVDKLKELRDFIKSI
ncbi:MAG: AAA family ATPase [Clostridium perfringens]|uniref:AAA family ATPase n=1 Tax=Clostridium perfringens TaxID=1502 RepID=UPI00096AA5AE|nr:AAA family ATPase [Clostridium perfringens]MDU4051217.1 AAA family ATPase [Clostridium perfringens]